MKPTFSKGICSFMGCPPGLGGTKVYLANLVLNKRLQFIFGTPSSSICLHNYHQVFCSVRAAFRGCRPSKVIPDSHTSQLTCAEHVWVRQHCKRHCTEPISAGPSLESRATWIRRPQQRGRGGRRTMAEPRQPAAVVLEAFTPQVV